MYHLDYVLAAVARAAFFAVLSLGTATLAQEKGKPDQKARPTADEKQAGDATAEITLSVSDAAPALKVEKFIKGKPVEKFEPGQIYVVEFWATWCSPCRAVMPHLTALQKKFKDKATFVGVNIAEEREYNAETLKKVEAFVKKNDEKMGYTVAFDGGKKETDKAYMKAAGQNGIPCAFVITGDAKVAYIGYPEEKEFEQTIQQLIDGKFDMKAAVAAAKERKAKEEALARDRKIAAKIQEEAMRLIEDDKLDEGLAKLDELAKLNPEIAPMMGMQMFDILMDQEKYEKAYEIAKRLIEGLCPDDARTLNAIARAIVDPEADVGQRDAKLAMKAAERAARLTDGKNATILDTLARCCWCEGEKAKAIETATKAFELARADDDMPAYTKEGIKASLDEYKRGEIEDKKEGESSKDKGKNGKTGEQDA